VTIAKLAQTAITPSVSQRAAILLRLFLGLLGHLPKAGE
jgi:hypothetical protein